MLVCTSESRIMKLNRPQDKPNALLLRALALLLLALALTACGSKPQPGVDREGLRDRADQETDQL
jgi:hypothetical protein